MTSSATASVSDRNVQPTNLDGFTELDLMAQLYPFPAIRVTRIARDTNTFWRTGNCWFTRLERLEALSQELSRKNCPMCRLSLRERRHCCGPIAGIILVDPMFQTQHARGLRGSKWTHNDRPELLNNFRKDLAEDGLRPPLMFMACPPAKSLNTLAAQRAYCLETLWYTDGSRLRVGAL
ncbi:MAG TPA: hypothetical protein PK992_08095 [Planctomycetaceae bacterium]|nr:hypothetical protein [Planctomycetaceae bacterium]